MPVTSFAWAGIEFSEFQYKYLTSSIAAGQVFAWFQSGYCGAIVLAVSDTVRLLNAKNNLIFTHPCL